MYTKGKWEIDNKTDGIKMNGITICKLGHNTDSLMMPEHQEKEDKANARLLAAAPALLEACKGLLDAITNWNEHYKINDETAYFGDAYEKACDIIAQAESEK